MPTRYRVDEANVVWRVMDDEAIVLHADSSAYFGLNRTATLLWKRLAAQPATRAQLCTWVRGRYPDAPAELPSDIAEFIDQLRAGDLLIEGDEAIDTTEVAGDEPDRRPSWEAPTVERFGELGKLILSGE